MRTLHKVALVPFGLACVLALTLGWVYPSAANAAPITVRVGGYIGGADFLGNTEPSAVVGSPFHAVYTFDTANAKYSVDQSSSDAQLYGASSAIGCRGLVGLSCIWNDGPGSPVVTSYHVSTVFGDFYSLPSALGFADSSSVSTNRAFPSIQPPNGNDNYTASKSQSIYFLSSNPETSASYTERLFQQSWNLQLSSASNGLLFGTYDDLTQTPNLDFADSAHFYFYSFLNAERNCTQEGCTAPTYGRGSFTFDAFITHMAVPEPGTLALLGFVLTGLAFTRRRQLEQKATHSLS